MATGPCDPLYSSGSWVSSLERNHVHARLLSCPGRLMCVLVYLTAVAIEDFLQNFLESSEATGEATTKYVQQLQEIANRKREALVVSLDDLESYTDEPELLSNVESNTYQYLNLIADAADAVMPAPTDVEISEDVFDIMMEQRMRNQESTESMAAEDGVARHPQNRIPPSLTRRYEVLIIPRTGASRLHMRHISSPNIGGLVSFKGIVTQVTDVRPMMTVATYLNDEDGKEYFQEITGKTFNPIVQMPVTLPGVGSGKMDLQMQIRGSKFVKYQEARVQENPDEVPHGSTPRTMTVQLRGPLARVVKAGDAVTISGIFMPAPLTGKRAAMRSSLLTTTYLHATHVVQSKMSYQDMALNDSQRDEVERLTEEGNTYSRLASSIAPEIYGHEDVKKALLLAMVGGTTRALNDGMKLRGDIHACLMGDPGVAKSQLLRYVAYVSPRAVYTSGKGSSGVGLTAAVVKDPTTSEMCLEGGALVMADKGICCIDEFDKMEEADRTSIHEVMEQQTVSIAKAGITTTLNTRTTVLAAANPAFGRYDIRRSPAENINLPAALLSRFDLLWLILDRPSPEADLSLAQHVLTVHRDGRAPLRDTGLNPVSSDLLRAYIAAAKQFSPYVPSSLSEYVATVYAELRQEEVQSSVPHTYTTARTLLSILRLSQALARLRFSEEVSQSDVDEALRLMKMSKASLYDSGDHAAVQDPISQIFSRIRAHMERTRRTSYSWADLMDLLGTSFKPEQIRQCLADYATINIWQLEGNIEENPGVRISA
jgi:DNA replication licensing factor MCM7